MINLRTRILWFILVLFLPGIASSQPFVTKIYTASDGLPDSYTHGLFQDRQNYIWIGSYTGLSRFDGQHFTTVSSSNLNKGTSGNVILEDNEGRLWVSAQRTISQLKNDSIIPYASVNNQSMDYIFGAIQLKNGKIWGLTNVGIFELKNDRWSPLDVPAKYNNLPTRQVIESPEGLYINFGTIITLWQKNGQFKDIIQRTSTEPFFINLQKKSNKLFANTATEMFDLSGNQPVKIFEKQLGSTLSYNFILDSRNRFWVTTEKYGILVSDPGDLQTLKHQVSLPFNLSTFLMEDREGNIWATNYEGLIKISDVAFNIFNKQQAPYFENIRNLAVDKEGRLYIAAAGSGLFVLSGKNTVPTKIFSSGKFDDEVIDAIDFDRNNNIWILTRSRRVFKYSHAGIVELTDGVPLKDMQLLFSINADNHTGKVLIASDKLYIGDEKGFLSWGEYFHCPEIINPRFINPLKDGRLIINTRDSGIYCIQNNKAIDISRDFENISFTRGTRIYEDPDSGIWVMNSGEGIIKFRENRNGRMERIVKISTKEGLPNNNIFSACFDKQKRLWIATLSGLAIVTKHRMEGEDQYRIHPIGQEMAGRVLNWGSSAIVNDNQNRIWISTFHELIQYDPAKVRLDRNAPNVVIENVKLFMKPTDWSKYADSSMGYFQIPYQPKLKSKENSITITFRGISFSANPNFEYSYQLASSDTNWSLPSPNNEVSFIKLPPGNYHFGVKARQTGTDWSKPVYFSFTINKPFWGTWVFRALVLLIICFSILAVSRYRINQVRRKARIQQQLHELEMKALKAQMNPHFIFNALNSIQSLVANGREQESLRYISKFAKLLRQVLEHSENNLVSLEKELATVELYVQLEMLRMNMNLDYSVEVDDHIIPENELVPPLILQPYVENALWHGLHNKEGQKRLRIKITADDEWIYALIEDNGLGRKYAEALKKGSGHFPRSMGMEITAKRLEALNKSNRENLVEIQDLVDDKGEALGTRVRVMISRAS